SFVDRRRVAYFNTAQESFSEDLMSNSSPAISAANLAFVESLYGQFLEDPTSVPEDFRRYFESEHPAAAGVRIGPSFTARSLFSAAALGPSSNGNGSHPSPSAAASSAPAKPARSVSARSVSARSVPARSVSARSASANGANGNGAYVNGNGAYGTAARDVIAHGGANAALALEPAQTASDMAVRQDRVDQLVRAFRVRGHMIAKVDPLGLPRPHYEELDPEYYGLGPADLNQVFS